MGKGRRLVENGLLVLATLLVLFVILEVAARVVLYASGDEDRFLRYASLRQFEARKDLAASYLKYTPHRYLGYIPTPGYVAGDNRHNELGYRDDPILLPKPAGEFRIVCLGGSTTYTPSVGAYEYSYPNVLERELHERGYNHVNVINGGVDGWTSYETLVNFAFRVIDLEPDMIIVHHGLNDTYARMVWPPEAFQGDNSGFRIDAASNIFMPSIFEYSTLIRGILIRTGRIQPHTALQAAFDHHRKDTFFAFEYEKQQAGGRYPEGVFEHVSPADMFEANDDAFFRRNIEHLILLAQHHGVKTVLATIPCFPEFGDSARAWPLLKCPEFLAECEKANGMLEEEADQNGAAFFDFARVFPKEAAYFQDGVHVTFEGVKVKGKLFADFLVESGLLGDKDGL